MGRPNTAASLDAASDTWSASPQRGGKGSSRRGKGGSKRTDPTDTAGTPWCENVNGLKLSDEIGCFVRFFQPTEAEKSERAGIEACVASCMRKICSTSTVKRVGAYSYGMSRYDAPLELVVEVNELHFDFGGSLCMQLRECGYIVPPQKSTTTIVATAPSGVCDPVEVVVSIVEGWRVHTRNRSRRLAKLLSTSSSHKASGQAAFVLGSILATNSLFKDLTTDVLTVMALAHLAQTGSAKEVSSTDNSSHDGSSDDGSSVSSDHAAAACFFRSFLGYLSSDDFCTELKEKQGWLFDARTGVTRTDVPGLFVRCPTDPNVNLAAECDASVAFRLKITAVTSYQQVTQTEAALSRNSVVRATDTRTPLSSVYAYHSYWPRKFSMENTVACQSPPSTPSRSSGVFSFDPYSNRN
ncbi:hypothetical protein DIPPA_62271 [Diplonema papillatum]|nr:hypothetical protein DIPPA_62271 [Diplonema papillatum]